MKVRNLFIAKLHLYQTQTIFKTIGLSYDPVAAPQPKKSGGEITKTNQYKRPRVIGYGHSFL